MSRKSRNRMRVIRAIVIALIVVLAIASAGYAIGIRIFPRGDGTVYINAGYDSDAEPSAGENVLKKKKNKQDTSDIEAVLEAMTLHEKVSQLFLTSPEALTGIGTVVQAGSTTQSSLNAYPVGGLVYAEKNLTGEEQTEAMVEASQDYAMKRIGVGLLIGSTASGDLRIGEDVSDAYLNLAWIPAEKSEDVSDMTKEELQSEYLEKLESSLKNRVRIAVMANTVVSAVDSQPASLSKAWIQDVLRKDLAYDGVVMTDDLAAISGGESGSAGARAIQALQAGADLLYVSADLKTAVQEVESAVSGGSLSESRIDESVLRILKLKKEYNMINQNRRATDSDDAQTPAADTVTTPAAEAAGDEAAETETAEGDTQTGETGEQSTEATAGETVGGESGSTTGGGSASGSTSSGGDSASGSGSGSSGSGGFADDSGTTSGGGTSGGNTHRGDTITDV